MKVVDEEELQRWIGFIQAFLKQLGWITDSFVLEFYQEDHWSGLPRCWQEFLPQLTPQEVGEWLVGGGVLKCGKIPPLGLQSLIACVKALSLERKWSGPVLPVKKALFKHVKPKKIHEVERFSEIVCKLCAETETESIFDVGSGVGHLSRVLTYEFGMKLTCIDRVGALVNTAGKFDKEVEKTFGESIEPPTHLCLELELNKHERQLQIDSNFGIIGLHSCGNLAPVILHNFVHSPAKFVVSVGCCYMKLDQNGFPLSGYGKEVGLKLSYESLEVACHAIEQYSQRITRNVNELKIHALRSALETILVNNFGIRRAGLRGVRHADRVSFHDYAKEAVRDLSIKLDEEMLNSKEIERMLEDWYKLVIFYSIRVLIANVVETLVILDRALFLKESKHNVEIKTLFDPFKSPRNFAIIGRKVLQEKV